MTLQPPPTIWQFILQLLGLIVRLPLILLAIVGTIAYGYLAMVFVVRSAVWVYQKYLSNPF